MMYYITCYVEVELESHTREYAEMELPYSGDFTQKEQMDSVEIIIDKLEKQFKEKIIGYSFLTKEEFTAIDEQASMEN